ncbi:MAG: Mobile element protein [Candidatus Jettenia ecosi]|uniref:Mobile element protein n=1 Tax=Candidatus Jettenia ecosi TaxID=2494326 RepID=A0A533Q5J7_9BACT|nr:MAG: Mobile element protein [Candidatus Jettenia ecosi]
MEALAYESQQLGHLGIIAGMCREIDLIGQIDTCIDQNERKVSVGQAVQAMIINALGFVDSPLYLTPEFFHNKPVEILIGRGLQAEDLNDDSLGRALDLLYKKGVTEVFAQVASHALSISGIKHTTYHLDSTSISFEGEYNHQEDMQAIEITHGYSRDKRPDLKQAIVSLICTYKSSIPVWLAVHSGNEVDKTLFPQLIDAYVKQLKGSPQPYFVADSALYSAENLGMLSEKVKWISRVPETIKEAKHLKEQTDVSTMSAEKEGYRLKEVFSEYGGIRQRWLLVFSLAAYKREEVSLQKRIGKELEKVQKEVWHLTNQVFPDKQAAEEADGKLQRKWSYHSLTVQYEPVYRYATRGHPKTGQQPQETLWKVVAEVREDHEKRQRAKKSLGKFILATNQLNSEEMSPESMLDVYKGQTVSVERGFRFLKDPLFFASGLFLHKPQRIMSLLMVMGLSLLVYSLAERKLRLQLAQHHEFIPNQVGKPTQNPTLRRVFQVFRGIHLLIVKNTTAREYKVLNLKPIHQTIIRLLGPHVENCYFFHL